MKRKINFGTIDFYNNNGYNEVEINLELKENEKGQLVFSASGSVWNARHTNIICGGQCLDDLLPYFKNNKLFNKIYYLWQNYHLNDMHPECEHQHTLGWQDLAQKRIVLNIYKQTIDTITAKNKIERETMSRLKNGESVKLTDHEKEILNLEYEIKTDEPLKNNISKYYEKKGTETKTLGWLREDEHKDGLLGRRCPVCDYVYGTSWKFFPIPQKDLEIIKNIINVGEK